MWGFWGWHVNLRSRPYHLSGGRAKACCRKCVWKSFQPQLFAWQRRHKMPLSKAAQNGAGPGHQRALKVDLQNNQLVSWSLDFWYFLCSTAVCYIIRQSRGCVIQIVAQLLQTCKSDASTGHSHWIDRSDLIKGWIGCCWKGRIHNKLYFENWKGKHLSESIRCWLFYSLRNQINKVWGNLMIDDFDITRKFLFDFSGCSWIFMDFLDWSKRFIQAPKVPSCFYQASCNRTLKAWWQMLLHGIKARLCWENSEQGPCSWWT